jgi:hypothetical protein
MFFFKEVSSLTSLHGANNVKTCNISYKDTDCRGLCKHLPQNSTGIDPSLNIVLL